MIVAVAPSGAMCAEISPDIADANPNNESLLRQLEAMATSGMMQNTAEGSTPLDTSAQFCSCNVREQFLLPAAVSQVCVPYSNPLNFRATALNN